MKRRAWGVLVLALLAAVLLCRRSGPVSEPTAATVEPSANRSEKLDATPRPERTTSPRVSRAAESARPPIAALAAGGPAPFAMRDRTVNAFFSRAGLALSLLSPSARSPGGGRPGWGLHWSVCGARAVELRGDGETDARIHSLVGAPSAWKVDQRTFGRVVYDDILPGVSLEFESRFHGVKYTVRAARAADAASLRFRCDGATEIRVAEGGGSV